MRSEGNFRSQRRFVKTLHVVALNFLLATCAASGQLAPPSATPTVSTGAISGSVRGEDGIALAGAVINYRRVPKLLPQGQHFVQVPGELNVSDKLLTDVTGAFAAQALPAGDYIVCVDVPAQAYLDPCKWAATPRVTVSANAIASASFVLKKGVFLNVRVNDPQGLLPRGDSPILGGQNLEIGVIFGNGGFHGVVNTGTDKDGRDHQLAIPASVPLWLWVYSRFVNLTDPKGAPISTTTSFQASPEHDHFFTLNVSARKL